MIKFTPIILALLLACPLVFAEAKGGGAEVSVGYQFSEVEAVTKTAEAMGLDMDLSKTNELMLDIHGWSVVNRFIRLGGIISGGYFDAKGEPSADVMNEDESGVGFGDARIAFLPEFHADFGPINAGAGVALGGGTIIPFINDDNGDNDGDMFFYGFMRPQITAAYDLGPLGVQVGSGYHLPLAGSDGEFWFLNSASDTIRHEFEAADMGGFFIKLGVFFGNLGVED